MKAGDIIENYQGRFAKIVEVKGSLYGVSAFVLNRDLAADETAVDVFLNEFGLSQIIKPKAEAKAKAEAEKAEAKAK
jgi:hypothetical protein